MEFNYRNFCSYIDELVRYKNELNEIIKTNGLIVITNGNKIYSFFIDGTNFGFGDYALTYWGIESVFEGDYRRVYHNNFTWYNHGYSVYTDYPAKAITEKVEQLSHRMESLDKYFDDVNVTYFIGDKGYLIISAYDKEKIKELINVKEDVFVWQNKKGSLTVRIENFNQNGAPFNVTQAFTPFRQSFMNYKPMVKQPIPLDAICEIPCYRFYNEKVLSEVWDLIQHYILYCNQYLVFSEKTPWNGHPGYYFCNSPEETVKRPMETQIFIKATGYNAIKCYEIPYNTIEGSYTYIVGLDSSDCEKNIHLYNYIKLKEFVKSRFH